MFFYEILMLDLSYFFLVFYISKDMLMEGCVFGGEFYVGLGNFVLWVGFVTGLLWDVE